MIAMQADGVILGHNGVAGATCSTCAYYQARLSSCMEWSTAVEPGSSCPRHVPANGALAEPAPPKLAARGQAPAPYKHQTRDMVLALRANGLPAAVIAERLGVTRQLVNYHLRRAKQQAQSEMAQAVLVIPTPVEARALARMLEAACEAWGDLVIEPSVKAIRLVRPAKGAKGA